jgi:hypothetical protein
MKIVSVARASAVFPLLLAESRKGWEDMEGKRGLTAKENLEFQRMIYRCIFDIQLILMCPYSPSEFKT